MNRIITFTAGMILICIVGYLLIVGRSLLIPLVIALLIWHLLNVIYNAIRNLPIVGSSLPMVLAQVLALLVVVGLIALLVNIIGNNVADVIAAAPRYQENIMGILSAIDNYFHIKILANFDSLLKNLDVKTMLVNVYGVFTTLTGSAVLIVLYVVALFVEQLYFHQKMEALFLSPKHRNLAKNIATHIVQDTQRYLGLKTLLSVITATASWVIMKWVGLDFAEFWALLIFFLNFIPNIGPVVATVFPAVLALIQFESWVPFVIVTSGIVIIQFIVGNVIESKYLSKSLNLSLLVVIFSLVLWGAIWGAMGMFLSVPITVMIMIICAHFDKTRPFAIILSQDGYVEKAYEKV